MKFQAKVKFWVEKWKYKLVISLDASLKFREVTTGGAAGGMRLSL